MLIFKGKGTTLPPSSMFTHWARKLRFPCNTSFYLSESGKHWMVKGQREWKKRYIFVWPGGIYLQINGKTCFLSNKRRGISCFSSCSPVDNVSRCLWTDLYAGDMYTHKIQKDTSTWGKLKQTNHINSGTEFAPLVPNKINHFKKWRAVTCFLFSPQANKCILLWQQSLNWVIFHRRLAESQLGYI